MSQDKLTPQEELFLGGPDTVRGYPEGDYGADQAIVASAEYWIPSFWFPKTWELPYAKEPLREQVHLIGFLDYGHGHLRNPSSDERRSRTFLGLGGGFAVQLRRNLTARLEWGVPLGDDAITESGSSQFHFYLRAEI